MANGLVSIARAKREVTVLKTSIVPLITLSHWLYFYTLHKVFTTGEIVLFFSGSSS